MNFSLQFISDMNLMKIFLLLFLLKRKITLESEKNRKIEIIFAAQVKKLSPTWSCFKNITFRTLCRAIATKNKECKTKC
jgi:hypothetical protein